MESIPQPIQPNPTGPLPRDPERPPYRAPLLRCHGALRDLTAQFKSGEYTLPSSKLNKENVVPLVWH